MKTNVINKNGNISEYGFACGHIQKFEGQFGYIKLHKEFHTYHLIKSENLKPTIWLDFDKLGPARKAFAKFKKEIQ
jgi:hypothetical protein